METFRVTEVAKLIEQVQRVGRRLITAQPRELAIGNVVRRVLGVIREEVGESRDQEANDCGNAGTVNQPPSLRESTLGSSCSPNFPSNKVTTMPSSQPGSDRSSGSPKGGVQPLLTSTSMFSLLSHPLTCAAPNLQPLAIPFPPNGQAATKDSVTKDLKAEIVEGIQEILDELDQADDQIAGYALDHIHSNEIILTHSSSTTVQRFLLKAAAKRKLTVVYAETYPNDHEASHATVIGRGKGGSDDDFGNESFTKTLTAAGVTVILIPDSAVFALMSRANKVLLGAHAVLADGSLVAAAGAQAIAKAARTQGTHVVVLSAVYQVSPVRPSDPDTFMENGDPSQIVSHEDGDFVDKVEIENPLFDYVPADLVDLYITNL